MARKRRRPEEEEAVLGDDPGRPLSYCCGGLDADVILVRSLCSEDLRGVHRVGLLHLQVTAMEVSREVEKEVGEEEEGEKRVAA